MQEAQEVIECPKCYWDGFDACLMMVLNCLDAIDMHSLPITIKDIIIDEAELYKKDG
jgi:hypothetical protein